MSSFGFSFVCNEFESGYSLVRSLMGGFLFLSQLNVYVCQWGFILFILYAI